MSKITATIVFDCDGDVDPQDLKARLSAAIDRQLVEDGLSGDMADGVVEDYTIKVNEPSLYAIDVPDYVNLEDGVTVPETFDTKAEVIAWAKDHLGADDQGNVVDEEGWIHNVISVEGDC